LVATTSKIWKECESVNSNTCEERWFRVEGGSWEAGMRNGIWHNTYATTIPNQG